MKQSKNILLIILVATLTLSTTFLTAQDDKSKRPSPPAQAKATVGKAEIAINYSQPAVKGRKIWGDLVPYGKVWRTGANEATIFEVSQDVKVEGETLKAGKYSLFSIPGETEWVFIFNSVPEQWGAFSYDESKDVLRVKAKPTTISNATERFTIEIQRSGKVVIKWDKLEVGFTVTS